MLRLLAAGLPSTEVAEQLVIPVSAGWSYIKSICSKTDAHGREVAAARGKQAGLIQVAERMIAV